MKKALSGRLAALVATLILVASSGCSGGSGGGGGGFPDPRQEQPDSNDLRQLGIAFHDMNESGKAPSTPEDLARYVKNDQRLIGRLKSGEIVFIYNVRLVEMTEGATNTVLAYVNDAPSSGGMVLFADGAVRKLSADEFKKATLAKPKGK